MDYRPYNYGVWAAQPSTINMRNNLSVIGRVFFGVSIAVLGILTIYYRDFPYMLIPPEHSWIPGLATIAYISGALLVLAGACIMFEKKVKLASLLLGSALLMIFFFYVIPFQLIVSSNNKEFGDWENAAKELTLCSGALIIAGGNFLEKNENGLISFLSKLIPFGVLLFSITIISYGIDHFLYAKEAVDYVPSWVPYHLFWIYFTGTALIGSALAIILKIKSALAATLLGTMTFSWFVILHIPRIVVSPPAYIGSEVASAMLALAYSGIAFVIAGRRQ